MNKVHNSHKIKANLFAIVAYGNFKRLFRFTPLANNNKKAASQWLAQRWNYGLYVLFMLAKSFTSFRLFFLFLSRL